MASQMALRFSPSRILIENGRAKEGYEAQITKLGQDRFDGEVDFEVRIADLQLSHVNTVRGRWQVQNNRVMIGPGVTISPGIYMTRVKPVGQPDDAFSNFDIILADTGKAYHPPVMSGRKISLPPAGAWMLFENFNAQGEMIGLTRIDVETDTGPLGGRTLRFCKTDTRGYWQPGGNQNLRWCIRERQTPDGSFLFSPGGRVHHSPWGGMGSFRSNVGYSGQIATIGSHQEYALLGGFGENEARRQLDVYNSPKDDWHFYNLLPEGRSVPSALSNQPLTLVDLTFGRIPPFADIDLWHMAALAPTDPDAALRMRYAESGAKIETDRISMDWSVVEDWEWREDGLISRIVQWADVPKLSWRNGYAGVDDAHLKVELRLVDSGAPDDAPLTLQVWSPTKQAPDVDAVLEHGAEYTLFVKQADGRPYHGFLEIEVQALQSAGHWQTHADQRSLWKDVENKPIYVSNGQVDIGGPAHGNPANMGFAFAARPYLVNSSLNSLYPVRDSELIPNASDAPFSNAVRISFGDAGT